MKVKGNRTYASILTMFAYNMLAQSGMTGVTSDDTTAAVNVIGTIAAFVFNYLGRKGK
jgi:hypothetical protein